MQTARPAIGHAIHALTVASTHLLFRARVVLRLKNSAQKKFVPNFVACLGFEPRTYRLKLNRFVHMRVQQSTSGTILRLTAKIAPIGQKQIGYEIYCLL